MAKFGTGSFSAAIRQGLRELRAAIYPDSNIAQPAEFGMYGTKTPGEIAESRRGNVLEFKKKPGIDKKAGGDKSLEGDEKTLEKEQPGESILESRLEQDKSRESADDRALDMDR